MVRLQAGWLAGWVVGAGLLVAAARPADAQPRPWQVGVTDEQKAIAQRWLEEGNALFVQNLYKEALAAYERGLASWRHPAIRFNVAKALIALDRPLEALTSLEAAMAHGTEPLADVWGEAVNYRSLLERQLAILTIACTQPGVAVSLDGRALAPCPSSTTERLVPGRHAIVARKPGFLTVTREPTVVGGQPERVELTLIALRDAAVTRTRWPVWKPWAVAASAAAVAGLGVALELDARATMDAYRVALEDECGERGCAGGQPSAGTAALERDARRRDRLGVGLMIAGGTGVAVGVALLLANRPYTDVPSAAGGRALTIGPLVTPGGFGVMVSGHR